VLFINIRELELHSLTFNKVFQPGAIDFELEQIEQISPLHVEGGAELSNEALEEIRVFGHAKTDLRSACSRCLEPVTVPVDSKFDLLYRPTPEGAEVPHEVALDPKESQIGFYEGLGIELTEILREHVLLSVPMQLVCKPDCKGICPVCGQNQNLGSCNCAQKVQYPRWSALGQLRTSLRK
jgi:uncharacterized protein